MTSRVRHGPAMDGEDSLDGDAPRALRPLDPRRYEWDRAALVARNCPWCGASGRQRFLRPDGLMLWLCSRCGTYYVSPAPDEGQLARLYDGYHDRVRVHAFAGTDCHARSHLPTLAEGAKFERIVRSRPALSDLRIRELASLMDLSRARVLDVGCGNGAFLWSLCSLGARGEGCDIDPRAVAFARERLGLTGVRQGTIADVPRDSRFDLVVLQDILEHLLRPREVLDAAAARLAPGGLLYLWTPNATLAEREPEPAVFRADFEHLQFFQTRGIQRLAQELQLELLHLETLGDLSYGDRDIGRKPAARRKLKRLLEQLPGFRTINRLRQGLSHRDGERLGNYHLFAILRRPPG